MNFNSLLSLLNLTKQGHRFILPRLYLLQASFLMAKNKHLTSKSLGLDKGFLLLKTNRNCTACQEGRSWSPTARSNSYSTQASLSIHRTTHFTVSFRKALPTFCLLHRGKSTAKPKEMAILLQRNANGQLMQNVKPH